MAAWLLLLLLQTPWAELRLDPPPRPADVETATRAVRAWAETFGVPEFADDLRVRMKLQARPAPLVLLDAEALVEVRSFRTRVVPLEGPEPEGRIPGEADLWSIPAPPPDGFQAVEAVHPVAGSAHGADCKACEARGRWDCRDCAGNGKRRCEECSGGKDRPCRACDGTSRIRCGWCQGRGGAFTDGRWRACTRCTGGRIACTGCRNGRIGCEGCGATGLVSCGTCRGRGRQICETCAGKGRVLETFEIVIRLEPRRKSEFRSRLPKEAHQSLSTAGTAPCEARNAQIAPALSEIPDLGLRGCLAGLLEQCKAGAAPELVRAVRIRAQVIPALLVGISYRDRVDLVGFIDGRLAGSRVIASAGAAWLADLAVAELQTGSGYALSLAQKALKLDPANEAAGRVLRVELDRIRAGRRNDVHRSYPIAPPSPSGREDDWRLSAVAILAPIAGLIAVGMWVLQMMVKSRRGT